MPPDAETGDGLPRAGSVQIASQRFLQKSLYRQPPRLSSPDLRYPEIRLCSQGNVGKALPPLAFDVIAVGRILSGGRPRPAARKIPTRGAGLRTVIVGGRRSEGGHRCLDSANSVASAQICILGTFPLLRVTLKG